MQVRFSSSKLRNRAGRRSGPHPPPRSAPKAEVPVAARDTARHRRAGGPEDRALYQCACGSVFQADVTASVSCPNCGTAQAW
jgi:hypothetical protein